MSKNYFTRLKNIITTKEKRDMKPMDDKTINKTDKPTISDKVDMILNKVG